MLESILKNYFVVAVNEVLVSADTCLQFWPGKGGDKTIHWALRSASLTKSGYSMSQKTKMNNGCRRCPKYISELHPETHTHICTCIHVYIYTHTNRQCKNNTFKLKVNVLQISLNILPASKEKQYTFIKKPCSKSNHCQRENNKTNIWHKSCVGHWACLLSSVI